jgi:magnesium chelatase family protein
MQVERYVSKLSGPLLDRIDLHVEVPAVNYQELSATREGLSSTAMREQVMQARSVQRQRFGDSARLNGRMIPRQIRQHCKLDAEGQEILKSAVEGLGLSARAHDRVLRVARTIADLENAPEVKATHVTEALNYRILDRKLWVK